MKKYSTVFASFLIMLLLGSVYAWSIIAAELIVKYKFSAVQTQVIFGTIIAIFPITMIFIGQIENKIHHRFIGYISGILFLMGYVLGGISQGDFVLMYLGLGLFSGVATGFGYWLSLTTPVKWFPQKKGLITGIASAGFGLGALLMSEVTKVILNSGHDLFFLLKLIGFLYGVFILLLSNFLFQPPKYENIKKEDIIKISQFLPNSLFKKLFFGIFLGTFAGLLIIGSLKIIGSQYNINNQTLVSGVALFAVANFLGRIVWGFISDNIGSSLSIFLSLLFQSASISLLNILTLSDFSYILIAVSIGFGFGGNFVLFAKSTAQYFGLKNLGVIYPFVFIGYAIAGILGPFIGGLLYDISGTFFYSIFIASFFSFVGSILFFYQYILDKKFSYRKSIKKKYF